MLTTHKTINCSQFRLTYLLFSPIKHKEMKLEQRTVGVNGKIHLPMQELLQTFISNWFIASSKHQQFD